ncbi:MAG: hypothetical protein WBD57_07125, partial [Candidatus Cybelea sp.]
MLERIHTERLANRSLTSCASFQEEAGRKWTTTARTGSAVLYIPKNEKVAEYGAFLRNKVH